MKAKIIIFALSKLQSPKVGYGNLQKLIKYLRYDKLRFAVVSLFVNK